MAHYIFDLITVQSYAFVLVLLRLNQCVGIASPSLVTQRYTVLRVARALVPPLQRLELRFVQLMFF